MHGTNYFPKLSPEDRVRVCKITCLAHEGAKKYWTTNTSLAGACVNSALALYLALLEEFDAKRISIPPRFVIGTFLDHYTRKRLAKKNLIATDMNYNHAWVMVGAEVYDPTSLQFTESHPFYAGPLTFGLYVPRTFNMRAMEMAFKFPETQLPQNLAKQIKNYIDEHKFGGLEDCTQICSPQGWNAK